jgi:transposase
MPKRPREDPKLESLRQHGTLNPRPQNVTDQLFATGEFFDPRDLVQVKYEMLRRVQEDGQAITEAVAKFGFSRPSFYQAQAAFQAGGLAGLTPQKRGPKQDNKLTAEVIDFIQQLLQQDPSLRSAALAARIKERFELVVHPRTIERGLARHQKKLRTSE